MRIFSGFALLPDRESAKAIMEFQESLRDVTGPKLGRYENLPHVSLFQGMYSDAFDPAPILDWARLFLGDELTANYQDFTLEPGNWAFANLVPFEQLTSLHYLIAGASAHAMTAPPKTAGMELWRPQERDAFENHGYRYAMSAYQPHVTVGYAECLSPRSLRSFEELLLAKPLRFDRIVFYLAGARGILTEVIESRSLAA
jgi:hypothetical protein